MIALLPLVSLMLLNPWCSSALSDSRSGVHRCRYAARSNQSPHTAVGIGTCARGESLFLRFCFPLPCTIPRSLFLRCLVRCCGKGLRGRSQDCSLRTTFHGLFQSPSLSPSANRRGHSPCVPPCVTSTRARLRISECARGRGDGTHVRTEPRLASITALFVFAFVLCAVYVLLFVLVLVFVSASVLSLPILE